MTDGKFLKQVPGLKRPPGYSGLMEHMAVKLGVDLQEALERKDISLAGVHHLMGRCSACGDIAGCRIWMAANPGTAEEPYQHCVNTKLLQALRDLQMKAGTF